MSNLPDELKFDENDDLLALIDAAYNIYSTDFLINKCYFNGQEVVIKRIPILDGKDGTFWHIVSEGRTESEKLPKSNRCVKVPWIKYMIENPYELQSWQVRRNGELRTCIADSNWKFLVILSHRSNYILLWTAYPILKHMQKNFQREFDNYSKNGNRPL